jgi:hypothetical protein
MRRRYPGLVVLAISANIGLPTKGAVVDYATLPPANLSTGRTEVCLVGGHVVSVDPAAAPTKSAGNLATVWNQKSVRVCGAGLDGSVVTALSRPPNDRATRGSADRRQPWTRASRRAAAAGVRRSAAALGAFFRTRPDSDPGRRGRRRSHFVRRDARPSDGISAIRRTVVAIPTKPPASSVRVETRIGSVGVSELAPEAGLGSDCARRSDLRVAGTCEPAARRSGCTRAHHDGHRAHAPHRGSRGRGAAGQGVGAATATLPTAARARPRQTARPAPACSVAGPTSSRIGAIRRALQAPDGCAGQRRRLAASHPCLPALRRTACSPEG